MIPACWEGTDTDSRPLPHLWRCSARAFRPLRRVPLRRSSTRANVRGTSRIVAIGDVHGAYDNMVAVLRSAGVIDKKKRWSGGTTHLVQTGDVLDRGDKEREVMDLLMKLEKQARKAGGRVHALLGNHEIQNFLGLFSAVAPSGFEAFRSRRDRELRAWYYELTLEDAAGRAKAAGEEFDKAAFKTQFDEDVVLGYVERLDAIGPKGRYGKWMRAHPTVTKIDDIVFLHGGISPAVAELSCPAVNATVAADLSENLQADTSGSPEHADRATGWSALVPGPRAGGRSDLSARSRAHPRAVGRSRDRGGPYRNGHRQDPISIRWPRVSDRRRHAPLLRGEHCRARDHRRRRVRHLPGPASDAAHLAGRPRRGPLSGSPRT